MKRWTIKRKEEKEKGKKKGREVSHSFTNLKKKLNAQKYYAFIVCF